ncbi:uncharacterized protein BP5553_04106 [Venustampulla echinocandica]|uniref:Uncharacterized protein n=1 Tax=Venustampulla echinocandica TaxID=2656787 RepID=A0A370TW55_9HELO|nr:uncharacterized protein BP5553_04106 [Venustampulla echinocandica]RDL39766.1 hypothetical protein BP5553_04106 [Venustampulla echinocandica]
MYRRPDEFQRTDISAAGSEWKANASLHSIIHDADHPGSDVDRSSKATPLPNVNFDDSGRVVRSRGGRGEKGRKGSGKGPLNPEGMPRRKGS